MLLDVLLWISVVIWVFFALNFICNLIFMGPLPKDAPEPDGGWPFVSIVVPARDEEKGIRAGVTSFCSLDYPSFEVIVVDDGSTDDTPKILAELKEQFSNLRVVQGKEPPDGWLGKPNALEAGRKEATGEWLLFVDADVIYGPDLLRRAMALGLQREAGMVFLGPHFDSEEVIEANVLSHLYFIAAAAGPTYLATVSKSKLFAAGGGPFNLVRRDALEACGAFESIKDAVADDVRLGFAVKGAGFRLATGWAGDALHVRMYEGSAATIEGFTKNIFPILRQHPWALPIPIVGGFFIVFMPYIGFAAGLASGDIRPQVYVTLGLMHAMMGLIAALFQQPWHIIFLNPVRELAWWWIILRSCIAYYRKGIVWRGRRYTGVG